MIDNEMRNVYNRKGNFVVTGTGEVFSVNENGCVQPYMNGGKLMVDMPSRNGTEFSEDLASVMAKSFYPDYDPNLHDIRFKDGNPNNCKASNIGWEIKPKKPVVVDTPKNDQSYPNIWYEFDFLNSKGEIDLNDYIRIKGAQNVLDLCPFNTMTTLNKRIREKQPIEGRGVLEGYVPRRMSQEEIMIHEGGEPEEKTKPFDVNPKLPKGTVICDGRSTISS